MPTPVIASCRVFNLEKYRETASLVWKHPVSTLPLSCLRIPNRRFNDDLSHTNALILLLIFLRLIDSSGLLEGQVRYVLFSGKEVLVCR